MIKKIENSITIIYYDNDSYLHHLYIGHAITALKDCLLPITVQHVDEENVCSIVNNIKTKYVVIFFSFGWYPIFKKTCENISRDSVVIVCHYVPTYLGKEIMTQFAMIDYAVVGEYDATLPNLIQMLIAGEDVSNCKGIMLREKNKISYTGDCQQIENLDMIGMVNRDYLPSSSNVFHIFGSRGCEGNCTFCDRNALYNSTKGEQRFRSIDNIISEIDSLVERFGCRFITFSDSTFCGSKTILERLEKLYFALKSKKYWVQFFINLRVEQINEEVLARLQQLKQVGLSRVFIGIESFNEKDIRLYNKKTNVSANKKAIDLIDTLRYNQEDYALDFEYGFILFNPYTTMKELENNIRELTNSSICANPNIISSRLVCNYIHPLTRKIYNDGLLTVALDECELSDKCSFDIKYRFIDSHVERIYDIIVKCYHCLSIKIQSNIIYIRNRYFHFYGLDTVLSNLDSAYYDWTINLSDFCKKLIMTVFEMEQAGVDPEQYAIELCKNYLKEISPLDRNLRICKQRALIQLQKKGEMIYD